MTQISVLTSHDEGVDWTEVHGLLEEAFAAMAGRIDPPSSLGRMEPSDLAALARRGWVVLARDDGRLVGCLFAEVSDDTLYLTKIAVVPQRRKQGVLRRMIGAADTIAAQNDMAILRLKTRVELAENHAIFTRLGFAETARMSHPGHTRLTTVVFERPVGLA